MDTVLLAVLGFVAVFVLIVAGIWAWHHFGAKRDAKQAAPAPAPAAPVIAVPPAAQPVPKVEAPAAVAPSAAPIAAVVSVAVAPRVEPQAVEAAAPTVGTATYTPNPASNTPDWRKWSDTSPEGYPLWYALQPDGQGGTMPVPGRQPTLVYDGQTSFANVQEIRDYMVAIKTRADTAAAADASADVPGVGFPILPADVVTTTLAIFDAAPTEALRWFHLLAAEHFALQNRGVTRAEINAKVNQFNSGAAPQDWNSSAQKAYRG
jgi:hypothetical protein